MMSLLSLDFLVDQDHIQLGQCTLDKHKTGMDWEINLCNQELKAHIKEFLG